MDLLNLEQNLPPDEGGDLDHDVGEDTGEDPTVINPGMGGVAKERD